MNELHTLKDYLKLSSENDRSYLMLASEKIPLLNHLTFEERRMCFDHVQNCFALREQKKLAKETKRLVYATWAVAFVTIVTIIAQLI